MSHLNYISGTIPNAPDGFNYTHPDKIPRTPQQIRDYILAVEDRFDLPFGILSIRGKKNINGHPIPEVKRAAIYFISQCSTLTYKEIAPLFGMKYHGSVVAHIRGAEVFIRNQDQTFDKYYSVVRSIAV